VSSPSVAAPNLQLDRRTLPVAWKLLRLRMRITVNGLRRSRGRTRVSAVIVGVMLAAFAVFLLVMSWLLLSFLQSPELGPYLSVDPARIISAIPVLVLTGLFVMVLLMSFGSLLQALYLVGDMDFLLAAPVPIRAVFVAKVVQAVVPVFGLFSLFGLPVLVGLGLASGYVALYYPLVLVAMVVLALAAAGASALLVMLVVRVVPPRRAAEILAFVGAILAVSVSQAGNLGNAMGGVGGGPSGATVSGVLLLASAPWLPLNWVGEGLVELGQGHWLTGLPLAGLSLGLAFAAFWGAVVTAERWYYSGWAGMQVVERRSPRKAANAKSATATETVPWLARRVSQPLWGLVWHDALTLRRDLRNLSQLVTPLIFGIVYTILLFRGSGPGQNGGAGAPGELGGPLRELFGFSSVGMSLFVGWMLLARLATTAFSREGRSYWLVKTAPISSEQLLAAKFLIAYVPVFALSLAFNVAIAIVRQMSVPEVLYSVVASGMCLAGMTGILLAFGVLGANFTWDDPRRMSGGAMGCAGQIWAMIYVVVAFGLFTGPVIVAAWLGLPAGFAYVTGLVLGSAVALGAAYLPLRQIRYRVARLDEPTDGTASWPPAPTQRAGR
jgi:ABC-2 type transport system permease protein